MRICSEAHITRKYCVSNDVFNGLFGISPLYIYDGELAKYMKFPTDCSSVSLTLYREFFFETVKVE